MVGRGEVGVDDVAVILLMFEFLDDDFEWLVVFTFALLHAEHDIAVHLDEAAIAVPCEALVFGGGCE